MIFYIVVIVVLIYFWIRKKFSYWAELGIAHVPGKLPMGSINGMGSKEHLSEILTRHYEQYKEQTPVLGLYFITSPALMIIDPEVIKDVFTRHFESFHERGLFYNEEDDPLTAHLFALGGEKWKEVRTKLTPTFTSGKMKMMFGTVVKECDRMIKFLEPQVDRNIEMKEILSSSTTQIIASVAFGLETECLGNPDNRFRKIAAEIFDPPLYGTIKTMISNSFQSLAKKLKIKQIRPETTAFFLDLIQKTVEYRESNNVQRNDFLQLLIQIKNSEMGMSLGEMAANSFIFFLAGFETSSSVATFALYELACNQNIQTRLRDEINEVLEKYDNEVTYDSIMEMKYLEMVFKETLRMYPVADTQLRKSTKEYQVPNTKIVIPVGTSVIVSTGALHHDERYFENPKKFDPERFSPENEKSIPSYAYLPFSEGPRICIGQRFGTMQTKLMLISLLRNYEILTCKKTLIPMKLAKKAAFQSPEGGMWLKLKKME